MKAIILATILTVTSRQGTAPIAAVVEGVVTDGVSGNPLPSAQVRLTATRGGESRPVTVSVLTDPEGHFRLSAPPAEYTVTVQRPGYFGPPLNGVPQPSVISKLKLADQQLFNQQFSLIRGGVINGRVLDQNGRPSERVSVSAMQVRYSNGLPTLTAVRTASANELGEYRLYWVPPGEYIVAFDPSRLSVSAPAVIPGASTNLIQTRTYFPGTTDFARAEIVTVSPGSERNDINFNIGTTPVLNVSGKLVGPGIPPPAGAPPIPLSGLPGFTLISLDSFATSQIVVSTFGNVLTDAAKQQGLFELRSIPPGRYELYATMRSSGGPATLSGHTQIELRSQDLKDVTITLHAPVTVAGRIVAPGNRPLPEKLSVELISAASSSRIFVPPQSAVDAGGGFTFAGVGEGFYRLAMTPPPGTFVADMRQGERSIYSDGLVRIPEGYSQPAFVEIVLGENAGGIAGTVTYPEGKPGIDTTVVAVPEERLRGNYMLYQTARADPAGQFTVNSLAPGRYKLFAWEGVPATAWFNTDFLSKQEAEGTELTISSGKTESVRVAVIRLR